MNEIRETINVEIAEEMKAKGYEVTFSENTLKVKTIKPIKKKSKVVKAKSASKTTKDIIKEKFEKLQQDLIRDFNIKVSFTESYTLRSANVINLNPKKKTTKNKKSKQTEPEQTVQQAA